MTASNPIERALADVHDAERMYPLARKLGFPVVAFHLGTSGARADLAAIEEALSDLAKCRVLEPQALALAPGVDRPATALDELRGLAARAAQDVRDEGKRADVVRSCRALADRAIESTKVRPVEARSKRQALTDEQLDEIVEGGAVARAKLRAFTGMLEADLLVERAPRDAVRLVALLAELPADDRWFTNLTWHGGRKRISIVSTLVEHVAHCALEPSRKLLPTEVAHALRTVGDRVVARRLEPEAAAIAARGQVEIERHAASIRKDLGL